MIDKHDIHPEPQEPRPAYRTAQCEIAREMKLRLEMCPDAESETRERRKEAWPEFGK